jgi:hypothetical protein
MGPDMYLVDAVVVVVAANVEAIAGLLPLASTPITGKSGSPPEVCMLNSVTFII